MTELSTNEPLKEKVLVIDDDYEICDLMGYTLEVSGYKAIIARNGYEGLELARKHKPDLIITDNHMPFMGGLEMLEVFRKTNIETPVIFMTGFGSENIAIDAFRLGINNYLIKPFEYGEAIEAIDWALREVRLRREKERVERSLLAAEAIQRTVVTLSHHINNQLMVIDLGFTLISEALGESLGPSEAAKFDQIVHESNKSVMNISAVLRVLQNISEVEYHDYSDQIEMLNIDEALKVELEQVSRLRAPVALSPSSFIVSQQPLI